MLGASATEMGFCPPDLGEFGEIPSISSFTSVRGLQNQALGALSSAIGIEGLEMPTGPNKGISDVLAGAAFKSLTNLDPTGGTKIAVAVGKASLDIFQNGLVGGRSKQGWDFFGSATKTSAFLDNSVRMLQQQQYETTQVFIEEVPSASIESPAQRARIILRGRSFRAERKALHYSIGTITLSAALFDKAADGSIQQKSAAAKAGKIAKEWAKSKVSDQGMVKPLYEGSGEVFLEPLLDCLHIFLLHQGEKCVIENGYWYASDGNIKVGLYSVNKGALLGQSLFHTKLEGEGWFILKLPVPFHEIHRIQLRESIVKISEDSIVLLRRGDIKFSIRKATKGVAAAKLTGEGLVNCYEGTGEVWYVVLTFLFFNGRALLTLHILLLRVMPTLNMEDLMKKRFADTQDKSIMSSLLG